MPIDAVGADGACAGGDLPGLHGTLHREHVPATVVGNAEDDKPLGQHSFGGSVVCQTWHSHFFCLESHVSGRPAFFCFFRSFFVGRVGGIDGRLVLGERSLFRFAQCMS